ncbi:MAG: DPP IV N-terminal domain-containing protein [Candidatus Methanofastidiosia archaeon]|jgi:hypothetical protein
MQYKILILYVGGLLLVFSVVSASHTHDACEKIAFISDRDGNWEIYTMNSDGSHQVNCTKNSYNDGDPCWSPDGSKIAFTTSHPEIGDGICVMNSDGSNQEELNTIYERAHLLSWSPDGKKIAFVASAFGSLRYLSFDIWVLNTDETYAQNVLDDPYWDSHPSWSPDGSKLAFTSTREGRWEIYTMNSDGSNIKKLLKSPVFDSYPDWSPDGKKIVFSSRRDVTADIYVVNVDGTHLKRLTNDSAYDSDPCWSPDGEKIVFYSDRDGDPDIYVMDADGSNIKRLTTDCDNWSPQWCCTSCRKVEGVNRFNIIFWGAILLIVLKERKIITPQNIMGIVLILLILPFFPFTPCNQDMCSVCRNQLEPTDNLQSEVTALMEKADKQGLVTSEMEEKYAKANKMLHQARIFCFKSQNCVAGNTLAIQSQSLLEELKNELEYMVEERIQEYAVYSALLKEWFDKGIGIVDGKFSRGPVQFYIIYEYTMTDIRGDSTLSDRLEYVCETMTEPIPHEIINDFIVKNNQKYPLDYYFDVPAKVILVGRTENREIYDKGYDYFELYARYPFSQGSMGLSRVAFNASGDHALVYVSNREAPDCGAGYYVLLIKEGDVWKVKDNVVTWIS